MFQGRKPTKTIFVLPWIKFVKWYWNYWKSSMLRSLFYLSFGVYAIAALLMRLSSSDHQYHQHCPVRGKSSRRFVYGRWGLFSCYCSFCSPVFHPPKGNSEDEKNYHIWSNFIIGVLVLWWRRWQTLVLVKTFKPGGRWRGGESSGSNLQSTRRSWIGRRRSSSSSSLENDSSENKEKC